MRIAVDLDGTLADIHSVFLEELEKQDGINYNFDQVESYYFEKAPFSVEKFHKIARKNWKNREIPVTDSSLPEDLNKLFDNHRVDIVTARGDVNTKILRNWLEKKDIKFNNFVVDQEKTDLGYDVLIDDSPRYIGNGMKILLYDRPYNRNVKTGKNSLRVKSFSEIRRYIERKLV